VKDDGKVARNLEVAEDASFIFSEVFEDVALRPLSPFSTLQHCFEAH
jgi:hypothetical protein